MRRLNDLLQADLPAGRFITLAIATLHPGGAVQLLSAGHGPSFLYCADTGEVRQFGGDGLPLGLDPAGEYDPPAAFQMAEGDLLVLLTDGFIEHQRAGDSQQFGITRVEAALVDRAGERPDAILRALDRAVGDFAVGAEQQDDMTAVVIKRTAPARHVDHATAAPTPAESGVTVSAVASWVA
jgi:serine phosphatase RsbU (regulator of sigma subunit)